MINDIVDFITQFRVTEKDLPRILKVHQYEFIHLFILEKYQ